MPNARVIKNRIKTVKNTGKITKTMAMVSTAKATKVIGLIKASRPYAERLAGFVKGSESSLAMDIHFSFATTTLKNVLLIVITANRGLCGGYNANLIRLAKEQAGEDSPSGCMVKKGISAFRFAGIEMEKTSADLKDIPSFDEATGNGRSIGRGGL